MGTKGRLHSFVLSEAQLAPAFLKKVPYCASSACTHSPVTSHSELVIVPVKWTLPFSFSFIFMSLDWVSRNTQQTCKHVLWPFCKLYRSYKHNPSSDAHLKHIWRTYEEHIVSVVRLKTVCYITLTLHHRINRGLCWGKTSDKYGFQIRYKNRWLNDLGLAGGCCPFSFFILSFSSIRV